jgi:hypothetical protein
LVGAGLAAAEALVVALVVLGLAAAIRSLT